jgi:hypothetical protein
VADKGKTIPIPTPYTNLKIIKVFIEVAKQESIPNTSCRIAFHLIKTDLPTLSEYD